LGTATSHESRREFRGLYTGSAHDDDFYSLDDGRTWRDGRTDCGDCQSWWGDLYQVNRVMQLDYRADPKKFAVFTASGSKSPDAGAPAEVVPFPDDMQADGWDATRGYRPVIQSLPDETPPVKGDYVAIQGTIQGTTKGEIHLIRAHDSLDKSSTDSGFVDISHFDPTPGPTGTTLWVQVAGGHARPVYYIGDGASLWRGEPDGQGHVSDWKRIVPASSGPQQAERFFVNPWVPAVVYVKTAQGDVYSSDSGGNQWDPDWALSEALLGSDGQSKWDAKEMGECGKKPDPFNCLLNDMAFDPGNPRRRFAAGPAGVFLTTDGDNWCRLLDTRATPSLPLALWFDPVSDQQDASLYVANWGRGILRLHPIPDSLGDLARRCGSVKTLFNGGARAAPISDWLDYHRVSSSGEVSAAVYDDFEVPAGENWHLLSLSGKFLAAPQSASPFKAEWEIRKGVSAGQGGVLVASGATDKFTWLRVKAHDVLPPGGIGPPVPLMLAYDMRATIAGSDIDLAPGKYFLMLRPRVGLGSVTIVATKGAESVGAPIGNGNSFGVGGYTNAQFVPITDEQGTWLDFSYGIEGISLRVP
ncbi:MAG TPA: hypothetical protein VJP78_06565, partial [Thermoleophilia bacterium]|nr:hypothetical protein [Thermoleophilia bacterium]